ncbi:MAG: VOC family protein [Bacilli bacterium]|nr:VOC family protein [Bacilli bacterium]
MFGVEIDFVVKNSLAALELYEKIFPIERVEVTNLQVGLNEVVFNLFGTRFHMLDENPEYGLVAPNSDRSKSIWFNVIVPDIKTTYTKAIDNGCIEVQAITDVPDFGMTYAIFIDPFGYSWMLHQIHRVVSHEERMEHFEDSLNK